MITCVSIHASIDHGQVQEFSFFVGRCKEGAYEEEEMSERYRRHKF